MGEFTAHKSMVQGWTDIKGWGYDLDTPGYYSVTATPRIVAFERIQNGAGSGPTFIASPEDISNSIRLQIVK